MPKKTPYRLILRCCGAVMIGSFVVYAFIALLSLYGVSPEPAITQAANLRPLRFPENEQMLDSLPDLLARDAKKFSGIEPAAGDKGEPQDLTEKMPP